MRQPFPRAAAFAAALCLTALPAWAQTFTPGTYVVDGGSYSITVDKDGADLLVHEPNKDSRYRPSGGAYVFHNDNNDTDYGLRVIDDHTIEAFKPGVEGNTPTRLVRLGGAPTGAAARPDDRFEAIASKYADLAQSDPTNVQSWAACAAVALKRSQSNDAEAEAYARQMAGMLKMMDAAASPCPEVITPANW